MSNLNTLRASLNKLTKQELELLKKDIESKLNSSNLDWIDDEYIEESRTNVKKNVPVEEVREVLKKIPHAISEQLVADREERI